MRTAARTEVTNMTSTDGTVGVRVEPQRRILKADQRHATMTAGTVVRRGTIIIVAAATATTTAGATGRMTDITLAEGIGVPENAAIRVAHHLLHRTVGDLGETEACRPLLLQVVEAAAAAAVNVGLIEGIFEVV